MARVAVGARRGKHGARRSDLRVALRALGLLARLLPRALVRLGVRRGAPPAQGLRAAGRVKIPCNQVLGAMFTWLLCSACFTSSPALAC